MSWSEPVLEAGDCHGPAANPNGPSEPSGGRSLKTRIESLVIKGNQTAFAFVRVTLLSYTVYMAQRITV